MTRNGGALSRAAHGSDGSDGSDGRKTIAAQLERRRPSEKAWAEWQRREPALDRLAFADVRKELLRYDAASVEKDRLLGALVRLGQHSSCGEARMAVIVCLLPGIRSTVRRYQDILGPAEAWAEMLAALWEQIGGLDLERRPSRVAANLLWDATNRLVRAVRRERAWLDRIELDPFDDHSTPMDHDAEGRETLTITWSGDGVLAPADAALISATRLDGIPLADAALLLGISYEAAKKRRQRAEAVWVESWAPERLPNLPAPVDRRSGPRAA